MQEYIYELFKENEATALLISFMLGLLVAVLGIIPSFFLTAGNILFFGFWQGTLISFISEALGNMLAFYLYRKGFRNTLSKKLQKHNGLNRLLHVERKDAFYLILALRVFPFVPSGLVSFAAAIGKVSPAIFFLSSTVGKIPAIAIEASAVYGFMQVDWKLKLVIAILSLFIIIFILYRQNKKDKN